LSIPKRTTSTAVILLSALAAIVSGCTRYHASPLDPVAHAALWQARSPADPGIREFLESLRTAGTPDPDPRTFDPDDGLTLDEAELVALVFNADLRLARLRAGVARATAEHSGLWQDPVFQIDALRILEGVSNPWVISPGLVFTIPLSGRLGIERAQASAALSVELLRVAEAEWTTRRELRAMWARWSALQIRAEETRRLLASLDQLVDAAALLVEAGELYRTEAALFAIERAQQRQERQRLAAESRFLELQMKRLLGLAPGTPVDFVGRWLPQNAQAQRFEELSPAGQNLTLLRLEAEYRVAEESLRREVARQYPDLSIGPAYESDQGQSRVGLLGALPLPLLNRNRQGIAEAEAERELARGGFEVEYQRVVSDLALLATHIEAIRGQREHVESAIVPMVDQQITDARRLLEMGEAGAGGAMVLLDSMRQAHAVKLDLIELGLAEAMAEIERVHLLGPTPEAVSQETHAMPEVRK
jgi:outer membrane protein, heavy metal efflux system